jgi:hypothetical protein
VVDQEAVVDRAAAPLAVADLRAQAALLLLPILRWHKHRLRLLPVQVAEGAGHSMAVPCLAGKGHRQPRARQKKVRNRRNS